MTPHKAKKSFRLTTGQDRYNLDLTFLNSPFYSFLHSKKEWGWKKDPFRLQF